MFKQLHQWLQNLDGSEQKQEQSIKTDLATAVLYVEVMRADNELADEEKQLLSRLLTKQFSLSDSEVTQLIDKSGEKADEANDLVSFTRVLNDRCDADEKQRVMVSLWKLAMADGEVDKHEEYTIRRIADLLYVPHSQFIQTKLSASDNN